jgi:RNase P/RNase MRP subunit POP5
LDWIKEGKNDAIISVNREAVNNVKASLALFPKKIEVKKVSGTLKSLRA